MEELMEKLRGLEPVPFPAAQSYFNAQGLLVARVNETMAARPDVDELIGHNPRAVMQTNHENHALFMANVMRIQHYGLLARVAVWVYRSYRARGFSPDYFPASMLAWMDAVDKNLEPAASVPIVRVYQWLLDHHELLLSLSRREPEFPFPSDPRRDQEQREFLEAMLAGHHQSCLKMAENLVSSPAALEEFYLAVLQPALYQVGLMWERGEISVAREHLASAIAARVMAALYPRFLMVEVTRGRAVISAAPNELHELGARMVADLLELDGWDVGFLGADVPLPDLLQVLQEDPPFLLGISAAMPFNLDRVQEIVAAVRKLEELDGLKVMVGGKMFAEDHELWRLAGADGWAVDAGEAVRLAAEWWEGSELGRDG